MLAKIVSIDEEFQKGRGPDKQPRKRKGVGWQKPPIKKVIHPDSPFYRPEGSDTVKRKRRGKKVYRAGIDYSIYD